MLDRYVIVFMTIAIAVALAPTAVVWSQTSPLPSPPGVPNPTVTPRGSLGPAGNQPLTGPNVPTVPAQPTNTLRGFPSTAPGAGPTSGVAQGIGPGQSSGAPLSAIGSSTQGVGRGLPGMPGGPPLDEPMGAGAVPCPYC